MTDEAIIDLYWQRDQQAIPETEQVYGPYCHTVAYSLLRSAQDAEESVNDTWLAAWNAMPPQRPRILKAFLGKLTRNIAVSLLRRRGSLKRGGGETLLAIEELSDCLPGNQDPEKTLETRELSRCIDRWLRGLPRRDRVLFTGRYFYGLTIEELAQRMGMRAATVKTVLYRSRESLRKQLEKEGAFDGTEAVVI